MHIDSYMFLEIFANIILYNLQVAKKIAALDIATKR